MPWDPPVYLTSGLERAAGAEKFFDHCLQGILPEKMVHFGKKWVIWGKEVNWAVWGGPDPPG